MSIDSEPDATETPVRASLTTLPNTIPALALEVREIKLAIGAKSTPPDLPGLPGRPGSGIWGALEILVAEREERKAEQQARVVANRAAATAAASKTGAATAAVLAVVFKLAELFLSSRGAVVDSASPSVSAHP